jgi:hypothetical protein
MNLLRSLIVGSPCPKPRKRWTGWPEGHECGPVDSGPWTAQSYYWRGFAAFDTRYRRLQGCVSFYGPACAGWNASFGFSKRLMDKAV